MASRRRLLAWLAALPAAWLAARAAAREGRPLTAFAATSLEDALRAQYGDRPRLRDAALRIEAPQSADNAAQVPLRIDARSRPVLALTLFAEHNPVPLLGRWCFGEGVEAWLALRIKLAASGRVCAVAELADGALLYAETRVEVGTGACG